MSKYKSIQYFLTKERGQYARELEAAGMDLKAAPENSQPGFVFSLGGAVALVASFLCLWYLTIGDSWQQNHAWEVRVVATVAGACWMALWACPAARIAGACAAMATIMALTCWVILDGLTWGLISFSLIGALSVTAWRSYQATTKFREFQNSLYFTVSVFLFLMIVIFGFVCILFFFPQATTKVLDYLFW